MSTISKKDVLRLAQLARLTLTDDEVEKYQRELQDIFEYVEKLQNVDTDDIEPTYQVSGNVNATRADEIIDYGATKADLMKNVPAVEDDLIKVKRMVG